MKTGNIPVKIIFAETIVEAFEKAVSVVWNEGISIPTEYDIHEVGNDKKVYRSDPPSKDATVTIVVEDPFKEPRYPKAFYDSLENLGKYIHEVISGVRDYRIKTSDDTTKATYWSYTYHNRLFNYKTNGTIINQIDIMIDKLSSVYYSRRSQAITWNPAIDNTISDPPCLQRIWCRLVECNGEYVLNMNAHWRSHDLFKAWIENVIALTELQKRIAEKISQKTGKKVIVGRYCEMNDSLHIYGAYFKDVERFLDSLSRKTSIEERAWTTEFVKPFFKEGLKQLLEEEGDFMTEEKRKILEEEIKRLEE